MTGALFSSVSVIRSDLFFKTIVRFLKKVYLCGMWKRTLTIIDYKIMKQAFLSICLLVSSFFFIATADDDYPITFEQLPPVSQTFVKTHFANVQVAFCLRDSHSYEVRLADASEIEFNLNGSWKEIDCKYQAVPVSVTDLLPKDIPTYVKTNFPTAIITKVNVKVWGYELELNNGLEVEFNSQGQFMRMDD